LPTFSRENPHPCKNPQGWGTHGFNTNVAAHSLTPHYRQLIFNFLSGVRGVGPTVQMFAVQIFGLMLRSGNISSVFKNFKQGCPKPATGKILMY
jgi:hypothetical protein